MCMFLSFNDLFTHRHMYLHTLTHTHNTYWYEALKNSNIYSSMISEFYEFTWNILQNKENCSSRERKGIVSDFCLRQPKVSAELQNQKQGWKGMFKELQEILCMRGKTFHSVGKK